MGIDEKDYGKQPHVVNIEDLTKENGNYRTTIWTGENLQVTVMSIEHGQVLCKMCPTVHKVNFDTEVAHDDAVVVPADSWHNIENTGDTPLKLYTIYAGPDHVKGTIHPTHEDAKNDPNEHYLSR